MQVLGRVGNDCRLSAMSRSPDSSNPSVCPCLLPRRVPLRTTETTPLSTAEPPVGRASPPSLCPANAADAHIRVVVFAAPLIPLSHGMHILAVLQHHLLAPRPRQPRVTLMHPEMNYFQSCVSRQMSDTSSCMFVLTLLLTPMGARHGCATGCTAWSSTKVKPHDAKCRSKPTLSLPPAVSPPSRPHSQSGRERPHPRCRQPCGSRWAWARWTRDKSRVQTCICHPAST